MRQPFRKTLVGKLALTIMVLMAGLALLVQNFEFFYQFVNPRVEPLFVLFMYMCASVVILGAVIVSHILWKDWRDFL